MPSLPSHRSGRAQEHNPEQPEQQARDKMATNMNMETILSTIKSMKEQLAALEKTLGATPSEPVQKKQTKQKKEKDPDAPKRAPTSWILFTSRVRSLVNKSELKDRAPGAAALQFARSLKLENDDFDSWTDELVLARLTAWEKPAESEHHKKYPEGYQRKRKGSDASAHSETSVPAAAAAAEPVAEKKKRKSPFEGLSEEEAAVKKAEIAARLKAGKLKKKAEKEASAPTSVVVSVADVPSDAESTESKNTEKKKGGRPKGSKNKPKAEKPANGGAGAEPTAEEPKMVVWKPIKVKDGAGGFNIYLWNPENNHCYHRDSDGSQGDWAGIYDHAKKTVTSAPEPAE